MSARFTLVGSDRLGIAARLSGHGLTCADAAPTVVACLPGPDVVERVFLSPGGLLDGPAALILDFSDSTPALARHLALAGERRGVAVLDVFLSASGEVVVGGTSSAFAGAAEILAALGGARLAGPAGAGRAAQLCEALLLGVTGAARSEAAALARSEGLDPGALSSLHDHPSPDGLALALEAARDRALDLPVALAAHLSNDRRAQA